MERLGELEVKMPGVSKEIRTSGVAGKGSALVLEFLERQGKKGTTSELQKVSVVKYPSIKGKGVTVDFTDTLAKITTQEAKGKVIAEILPSPEFGTPGAKQFNILKPQSKSIKVRSGGISFIEGENIQTLLKTKTLAQSEKGFGIARGGEFESFAAVVPRAMEENVFDIRGITRGKFTSPSELTGYKVLWDTKITEGQLVSFGKEPYKNIVVEAGKTSEDVFGEYFVGGKAFYYPKNINALARIRYGERGINIPSPFQRSSLIKETILHEATHKGFAENLFPSEFTKAETKQIGLRTISKKESKQLDDWRKTFRPEYSYKESFDELKADLFQKYFMRPKYIEARDFLNLPTTGSNVEKLLGYQGLSTRPTITPIDIFKSKKTGVEIGTSYPIRKKQFNKYVPSWKTSGEGGYLYGGFSGTAKSFQVGEVQGFMYNFASASKIQPTSFFKEGKPSDWLPPKPSESFEGGNLITKQRLSLEQKKGLITEQVKQVQEKAIARGVLDLEKQNKINLITESRQTMVPKVATLFSRPKPFSGSQYSQILFPKTTTFSKTISEPKQIFELKTSIIQEPKQTVITKLTPLSPMGGGFGKSFETPPPFVPTPIIPATFAFFPGGELPGREKGYRKMFGNIFGKYTPNIRGLLGTKGVYATKGQKKFTGIEVRPISFSTKKRRKR